MTEATEAARQIVAELENKLAAAEARAVELQTERRRLSFAANTGDGAAEKRLKALNTEAAHINLDIENVRSAMTKRSAVSLRLSATRRWRRLWKMLRPPPTGEPKTPSIGPENGTGAGPENGSTIYISGDRGAVPDTGHHAAAPTLAGGRPIVIEALPPNPALPSNAHHGSAQRTARTSPLANDLGTRPHERLRQTRQARVHSD